MEEGFSKTATYKKIYFALRKDKDNALSFAEGLGRLVYTGFRILDLAVLDNVVYFTAARMKNPHPKRNYFTALYLRWKESAGVVKPFMFTS